nr:hypothetical protein Itr_chr11CG23790 [Ipomoea trifida]
MSPSKHKIMAPTFLFLVFFLFFIFIVPQSSLSAAARPLNSAADNLMLPSTRSDNIVAAADKKATEIMRRKRIVNSLLIMHRLPKGAGRPSGPSRRTNDVNT